MKKLAGLGFVIGLIVGFVRAPLIEGHSGQTIGYIIGSAVTLAVIAALLGAFVDWIKKRK